MFACAGVAAVGALVRVPRPLGGGGKPPDPCAVGKPPGPLLAAVGALPPPLPDETVGTVPEPLPDDVGKLTGG
ncbi:MAG: hypothetical protein NVS4B8_07120 [Herpetosiphon sp.]